MSRELELLEALQTDVHGIKKDMTEMRGDMTEMRGDMTELRGDITELRGDITELRGDITELRGDNAEIRGEIAELRDDLKQDIQNLREEVTDGFLTVHSRIDETNRNLTGFRREVNHKLKGMGELIINIDKHVASHDRRILALEQNQIKDQGTGA